MPDSWTTTALLKRVRGVLANTGMWGIEGVKKYEVKTLFFLITRRLVSFSFFFFFFYFFPFFPLPPIPLARDPATRVGEKEGDHPDKRKS
jgi:hypothetical protein